MRGIVTLDGRTLDAARRRRAPVLSSRTPSRRGRRSPCAGRSTSCSDSSADRRAPARRRDRAARPRAAARRADRHAVERPAQARAARDRPADAAAGAARRRAVRRPRPPAEPRGRRRRCARTRPTDARSCCRFTRSPTPRASAIASCCSERARLRRGHVRRAGRAGRLARRASPVAISKRCSLRSRSAVLVAARARSGASWSRRARGGCCSRSIGPLVGVSFISAVRTYAELSGRNGTAAGVGEVFSPLDRHLGADVQRVRAGRGVPAAVRRDPPRLPAIGRAARSSSSCSSRCRRSRAFAPRPSCCSPAGC